MPIRMLCRLVNLAVVMGLLFSEGSAMSNFTITNFKKGDFTILEGELDGLCEYYHLRECSLEQQSYDDGDGAIHVWLGDLDETTPIFSDIMNRLQCALKGGIPSLSAELAKEFKTLDFEQCSVQLNPPFDTADCEVSITTQENLTEACPTNMSLCVSREYNDSSGIYCHPLEEFKFVVECVDGGVMVLSATDNAGEMVVLDNQDQIQCSDGNITSEVLLESGSKKIGVRVVQIAMLVLMILLAIVIIIAGIQKWQSTKSSEQRFPLVAMDDTFDLNIDVDDVAVERESADDMDFGDMVTTGG
eukprot:242105_1